MLVVILIGRIALLSTCFNLTSPNNGEYKFVIISKSGFDLDTMCKKMREALGARGGGRNGIVQGSVSASEEEIRKVLGQ